MAAFTANQVTVNNGQKNIVINSSETPVGVRKGDFIGIASFALIEINRTYVDSNNKHVIELVKNWGNSNQSNQPAIVIPTTVDFKQAADALKTANTLFNDNTQAMQNWQTKTGNVTFNNIDGTTTTVKTLKQIENEAQAQLEEYHPYPYAMRKVEFEARRAANNEKFAASGFVYFGKMLDAAGIIEVINEGLGLSGGRASSLAGQLALGYLGNSAETGNSKTKQAVVNICGVVSNIIGLSSHQSDYGARVKLPPTEDGTRTYDSATGLSVTHASPAIAFASETTTNKVVTDRTDMWGFEAFLREINDADPFVYDNGLIQSLATSINGVATVSDNVRPITYFAWYEGDVDSRSKGVNWQTATETQRIAIASDPNNNIYFDDATSKFYQWCLRGRSVAGLGNGDWDAIDTAPVGNLTLRFDGASTSGRITPQGVRNAPPAAGVDTGVNYFSNTLSAYNLSPYTGVFSSRRNDDSDASHTYFLVCGTVNRLNQGAYHPSFNSGGTSNIVNEGQTSNGKWYVSGYDRITSKSQCFDLTYHRPVYGSISNPASVKGRQDSKAYDAIYASGQGGVCRDMRYSAWGLTQEDFAEADLKIKSGEYRGRELLVTSKVLDTGYWDTSDHSNKRFKWINYQGSIVVYLNPTLYGIASGDSIIIVDKTAGFVLRIKNVAAVGVSVLSAPLDSCTSLIGAIPSTNTNGETSTEIYLIHEKLGTYSLSSEYLHTEVIAPPANILQCDVLKEGWVGNWNPNIPNGTDAVKLTRKALNTTGDMAVYTSDFGSSWGSSESAQNLDLTNNTIKHPTLLGEGNVVVYTYAAQAKYTQSGANSPIHGASVGVGQVFTSMDAAVNKGVLLCSFLTGKVSTHQTTALSIGEETLYLTSHSILSAAKTLWGANVSVGETKHTHLNLSAPTNQSHAFKALNYNVVENQQGFINYAYTELKHNGSDWGDDGKIHIVSNESTMLDDNGQTVKVGTARIVEPLGWVKNDK
ncbi:hypothetical protein [Pseudoalteromonas fuliginea]|uniref:hypothetical protein n=1 Tax=Pseudoalteromonas fuliginea TaxID=1872678 RepID=UPI003173EEA0